MTDIPTDEPVTLRSGDTWKWRREDLADDYPAPTWTLSYYFKNASANFTFNASASGIYFSVSVAKATTGTYTPGIYQWQAFVDNGTERYKVDEGTLEVEKDFAVAGNYDGRSHARQVLEAIETLIESKGAADVIEYTIGNRSIKKMPMADLIKWRSHYVYLVSSEDKATRLANGLNAGGKIQVRF